MWARAPTPSIVGCLVGRLFSISRRLQSSWESRLDSLPSSLSTLSRPKVADTWSRVPRLKVAGRYLHMLCVVVNSERAHLLYKPTKLRFWAGFICLIFCDINILINIILLCFSSYSYPLDVSVNIPYTFLSQHLCYVPSWSKSLWFHHFNSTILPQVIYSWFIW